MLTLSRGTACSDCARNLLCLCQAVGGGVLSLALGGASGHVPAVTIAKHASGATRTCNSTRGRLRRVGGTCGLSWPVMASRNRCSRALILDFLVCLLLQAHAAAAQPALTCLVGVASASSAAPPGSTRPFLADSPPLEQPSPPDAKPHRPSPPLSCGYSAQPFGQDVAQHGGALLLEDGQTGARDVGIKNN